MGARIASAIPVLFVSDVNAAVRWYCEKLGFAVSFESPWNYSGVQRDGVEFHIGRGNPPPLQGGAHLFFMTKGIDDLAAELQGRGVAGRLVDQEYGARELHVDDPFGYHIAFSQMMA
jgi:catechol 2,3-dioxygenase-like lactoylglutathione lyase family enzyme